MAISVRQTPGSEAPAPVPEESGRSHDRRQRTPLRDNTRLLLLGIGVLVLALVGLLTLANRSTEFAPDFFTDFVLYALSATNLAILLGLGLVLVRNIVKLVVERRSGLPFARFRSKLVAVLLGMTLIPAVLVLAVGSELIRTSVDRWFNAPMDEVLASANALAGDYYEERQAFVSDQAQRLGRALASVDLVAGGGAAAREIVEQDVQLGRLDLVEVYSIVADGSPEVQVARVTDAAASTLVGPGDGRASADQLAEEAAMGAVDIRAIVALPGGGELIRTATPIRSIPGGPVRGVVIASEYLTGEFAARARRMTGAYEDYQQLRVLRQPLMGVYLSFFIMLTLMILVGATWMGLYLAKRITRPVQLLSAAADEIGAGHLDHRVVRETRDEFGALVDAFNRMAGELSVSRRRLEESSVEIERRHHEVEGRRRYVETVLNRIASGVLSVDRSGRIRTANRAALRLLHLEDSVVGRPASVVFGSEDLRPLAGLIDESRGRDDVRPQEVAITRAGGDVHLAAMATSLSRDDGVSEGVVLVFDDVTPLIRAQRVAAWREIARRLAHEIKNPLTPIQLCAERLRRHFGGANEQTRGLVDECTTTIVGEVESLKELVDEFSQFARMPAPRTVPTDLEGLLTDTVALYAGLLPTVQLETRFAPSVPTVTVDPEQIRRVVINLVDNAVEAISHQGVVEIATEHDPSRRVVRIVVADNGPGIPAAERKKLFTPYYSTKQRGSGLGLAIVRRIVTEHGGAISVTDNTPQGTRFAVELPA